MSGVRPAQARDVDAVLRRLPVLSTYSANVFRLTGLPTDAGSLAVRRRREELAMAARLGTSAANPQGALVPRAGPDPEALKDAFEALSLPLTRLVHEAFWPLRADGAHAQAVAKHCRLLDAVAVGAGTQPGEWNQALQAWARVLADEQYWAHLDTRVGELDDPRVTPGHVAALRERLPGRLVAPNAHLALRAATTRGAEALVLHRAVLAGAPFPAATVSAVLRDACRPIVERLQDRCAGVGHALAERPATALAEASALIAQAPERLAVLEAVLPAGDPLPGALHDEVAATAVRAAVGRVNAGGDVREAESLLAVVAGLARESTTHALVERTRAGLAQAAILAVVEPWLAAGDPDGAREVLRTWSRRSDVMDRQECLDRMLDDQRALRAELSEVPTRVQLLGCGVRPFGHRVEVEDTWVETRFVTVFWVPVHPLASYLSDEDFVYAKVPSPRWVGILRPGLPISAVLLLVAGVLGLWPALAAILGVIAVLAGSTLSRRRTVTRWLDESLSEPAAPTKEAA